MTVVGVHASHEQIHPTPLLEAVQAAEAAGFTAAMCSDHFSPWSQRQGHSPFAWSWLGAALQATGLPFGVLNAPGQRYHPAIIAQASATLAAMYPGRFWVALGTGEASNEHITGGGWLRKDIRNARTLPEKPPLLVAAAVSVPTAQWAAEWADGLITVNQPPQPLRDMALAYREAGGRGKLYLQVHLSYAAHDDTALRIAHEQWRTNVFPPPVPWDLVMVEHFDIAATHVPPEAMRAGVLISSDPAQHAAWLQDLIDIGFDEIFLHHAGQELLEFLDVFGQHVLPQLEVSKP